MLRNGRAKWATGLAVAGIVAGMGFYAGAARTAVPRQASSAREAEPTVAVSAWTEVPRQAPSADGPAPTATVFQWIAIPGDITDWSRRPPVTLPELVTETEVIVVGRFDPVETETIWSEPTPDDLDEWSPSPFELAERLQAFQHEVTRFEFMPSEVLLNDGHVAVGQPIKVETFGYRNSFPDLKDEDIGWPVAGREYVLFLISAVDPPDVYVQTWYDYSLLYVEGDVVHSSHFAQPIPYQGDMTPDEFMEALREEIARQYPRPGNSPP